jgi:type IV secretion system protein VirB9
MIVAISRRAQTALVAGALLMPAALAAQASPRLKEPVRDQFAIAANPLSQAIVPRPAGRSHSSGPQDRVGAANQAARIQPEGEGFVNAIQQYAYAPGALYQVYTSPGQVTDIALQEGETLAGTGPVAAGDTVRWMIGDTTSGTGPTARVHILVKPTRSDIATNLVINTDRRTYYLEMRATPSTYMASVSWQYPQDQLIALRAAHEAQVAARPVAAGIALEALNFRYSITGDKPKWAPVRVFDDGRQAYVEFPEAIGGDEMPPLFVTGADGAAELVNYRVSGRYMIVDRLFDAAELRLGDRKTQQRVYLRSVRRPGRP